MQVDIVATVFNPIAAGIVVTEQGADAIYSAARTTIDAVQLYKGI